jgi:hypothetical protein
MTKQNNEGSQKLSTKSFFTMEKDQTKKKRSLIQPTLFGVDKFPIQLREATSR